MTEIERLAMKVAALGGKPNAVRVNPETAQLAVDAGLLISSSVARELLAFYDAALEEVVPARPEAETARVAEIRREIGG